MQEVALVVDIFVLRNSFALRPRWSWKNPKEKQDECSHAN